MDFRPHELGYYASGRCLRCGCNTTAGKPTDFNGKIIFSKNIFCSNRCYWIWLNEREQDLKNTSSPLPELNYFTKHPDLKAEEKIQALLSLNWELQKDINGLKEHDKFLTDEANKHLNTSIKEKNKNIVKEKSSEFGFIKTKNEKLEAEARNYIKRNVSLSDQLQKVLKQNRALKTQIKSGS